MKMESFRDARLVIVTGFLYEIKGIRKLMGIMYQFIRLYRKIALIDA